MKEEKTKHTLQFEFTEIIQLYRAYMPFVLNGGLFLPCEDDSITLGSEVVATITLPEDTNPITISGKVIWLSPKKLLSEESKAGIGIQIEGKNANEIREQIEDLIKDYLNSDQPTDTM